jgi:hypothetical protein
MAVFTPGPLISEIRGKINGKVFSRNHWGPFVRARIDTPQTASPYLASTQAALAEGVSAWQSLSFEEQQAWNDAAKLIRRKNSISYEYALNGYAALVGRYVNRMLLGSTATGFQPMPLVRAFPWISEVTYAPDEINIHWRTLGSHPFTEILFYASAPFSTGINAVDMQKLRYIDRMTAAGSSGSKNVYTAYVDRFNPCVGQTGLRVLFAVKAVNQDNFAGSKRAPFMSTLLCEFTAPCGTFDITFDNTFR